MRSVVLHPLRRCLKCNMALRWCVCPALETVAVPLAVDVLMHHREQFRPSSTGHLIRRVIPEARIHGYRRERRMTAADRDAVERALAVTRTEPLGERWFDELSSGERQRVALAQALAQQPRVLLLDEPTAHLDLGHQTQLLDLIRELQSSLGLACVLVSHDLNSAAEYAVQLAQRAGARRLVLFHHDPSRTDEEVDALVDRLNRAETLPVEPALEGATIQL